ncbi:DUF5691 domain-containing protein [Streptomyces sp. NPDC054796]
METTAPAAQWSELVSAALLGAERRTPPGGSVHALLDAAAAETVRRRAALLPAPSAPRTGPAPEDVRRPLPEAARRRLAMLLAGRSGNPGSAGARRSTAPDLAELLPQWLSAANERGYRAPAELLPALLDTARARTDLRREALAFAGPRGLWLARLNRDWRFALRNTVGHASTAPGGSRTATQTGGGIASGTTRVPEAGVPDVGVPEAADAAARARSEAESDAEAREVAEDIQRLWGEGLFAERVSALTALRRRDPAAGLALLTSTWSTERAEDRLMFLDSLREGLHPDDEPFLERALSDRSHTVRSTAAELLSGLPGSALSARMADRARSCVVLDPLEPEPRIAVEAPHEYDAAMRRDGVVQKPPAGRGERAWWLGQLVEATPLEVWSAQFGGRTPEEIAALPVADDWRQDLHAAWCRAAVRQRSAPWARALIGPPSTSLVEGPGDPAKLLTVLPKEERARWAARFIEAHGLSEAFRILGVCAVPWSDPLGRAVVDALEIARDAGSYPWSFSGVMGLAERCLDPSDADRLAPLAAVPDEPEDGSPGAGAYWAETFQRLVGTLRLRALMRAELDG